MFFNAPEVLPRGRHKLGREQVIAVQRERIMTALVELMAARGYHAFSVGDVATRAGVSRSAFYDCFKAKEECAFAAHERFIQVVLGRIAERTAATGDWDSVIRGLVGGYLDTLCQDLVVARAFQVELDAIGPAARRQRREALVLFADHHPHAAGAPASDRSDACAGQARGVPRCAVHAARQLACDALE